MAEYREQEKDLVFALDIGTRSVVGVVGRPVGERFKVLAIEAEEHGKRAMLDGQIDDIDQVAALARTVTGRLESKLEVRLSRVCVAAAGRALRTQRGSFSLELPEKQSIGAEQISRLEAGAVSAAEEALQEDEEERRAFFLVGYTVAQYRLDNYPLTTLQHHNGKKAEADVVATFLPGEVVESLYAAMRGAGLQVASMTLEPIAAMNAAIPAELRLLNLALVDIGAGTSDIALCRDGSVVGYTMATVAGDEITEAIMRAFLVDFHTAEEIKRALNTGGEIHYTDILGLEADVSPEEVGRAIQEPMERLAGEIARQVVEVNGGPPSALFLAGGGSKLSGLRVKVAATLGMDERRVATAGNNFSKSAFSEELDLENPEYATPLGIAVSAGMGLINDSYVVLLNGEPAKLFRNGALTLQDILLMNGYTYADMLGRTGQSLSVTLNGKRAVFRGEPAAPAVLRLNGEEASITARVHAGDRIEFTPARSGAPASKTLGELLGAGFTGRALVNNRETALDTPLRQGDTVLTLDRPAAPLPAEARVEEPPPRPAPAAAPPPSTAAPQTVAAPVPAEPASPTVKPVSPPDPAPARPGVHIYLNGRPLGLPGKEDGTPYYLMDLLEFSGIDFDHLDRPVTLEVNGRSGEFLQVLQDRDQVTIRCE